MVGNLKKAGKMTKKIYCVVGRDSEVDVRRAEDNAIKVFTTSDKVIVRNKTFYSYRAIDCLLEYQRDGVKVPDAAVKKLNHEFNMILSLYKLWESFFRSPANRILRTALFLHLKTLEREFMKIIFFNPDATLEAVKKVNARLIGVTKDDLNINIINDLFAAVGAYPLDNLNVDMKAYIIAAREFILKQYFTKPDEALEGLRTILVETEKLIKKNE